MKKSLSWLHLSDLHIGQKSQWLWPNFKDIFLSDISRLSVEAGKIDLVIFSGDLTNSGSTEEFEALTRELLSLWEVWDKLNLRPLLFAVPGNHDLVRPSSKDARMKILTSWGNDKNVINEFWDEKDNQYLNLVNRAFENYMAWLEHAKKAGIPFAPVTNGALSGDISASIELNDISIGLIGLNSTFLQLNGENFKEKLVLSGRQLNALTADDPPGWCKKHDINFLVTHHPFSWLNAESQKEFNSEIYPSGRFTIHLHGHMHDADLTALSYGGSIPRKTYQSASLFGMEFLGDGKTERNHGYSIGKISYEKSEVTWKLWPRKGIVSPKSGDRKIIPDHENFEIENGEEYQLEKLETLSPSTSLVVTPKLAVDLSSTVEESKPIWDKALANCLLPIVSQEQHLFIRPLEQQACIENIRQKGMAWICADWGLGREGFLWSILRKLEKEFLPIYQISLGNYQSREDFLSQFSTLTGCSFSEFCKALASTGPAFLLLDDVPVAANEFKGLPIELDVENLAATIKDFCPEITIILLARANPQHHNVNVVILEPLDEADTKTYLEAHPKSTPETKTSHAVNVIYRCTDGLPGKIDSTLKTLRVVSLSDLEPTQLTTLNEHQVSRESVPLSLVKSVAALSTSKDPSLKRAYLLLKSLALLPHGESLERLKRIENQNPIFPKHAEELLDSDLIQVRISSALIRVGQEETPVKILYAPTPVRDYVLLQMSPREIDSLIKKAANLYFGEDWRSGSATLKKIRGGLISDDGSLMGNPHGIVMRLLKSSLSINDSSSISSVMNLCKIYCQALYSGEHYRNCVTVCRDVLSIAPDNEKEAIRIINTILAKSLRMVGEHSESIKIIEEVLKNSQSNQEKVEVFLVYALALQSLDDPKAIEAAEEVIRLDPESACALQAMAILIEMSDAENSSSELLKIEKKARELGKHTVANNLALDRVSNSDDYLSLRTVHTTAVESGDAYIAARAVVRLATLVIKDTGSLPPKDLNDLINAYQYFYGERFIGLFTKAHTALWDYFAKRSDVRNLLILFRHSSFIWRLNGDEDKELEYVKLLSSTARNILTTNILTADKNTSYFLVRARNAKIDTKPKRPSKQIDN